jgi:hypothetical protein
VELTVAQGANLALRFLVELAVLAALASWGFGLHGPVSVRVVAGVGAPLSAAVVWGLFASPRAALPLPAAAVLMVQVVVLVAAVLALVQAGKPALAGVLAVVAVGNGALMAWWGQ